MRDIGYDSIRDKLKDIPTPGNPVALEVRWLLPGVLAVGKSHQDSYVLILCGTEVAPSQPAIDRAMSFGSWKTGTGEIVDANRLDLPAGNEFAMATATIAAELIRQGIGERPLEVAFPPVEDFIARLLGQLSFSAYSLAGLLGELLLLRTVINQPGFCEDSATPTSIWQGPKHDARDFRYGRTSIEVKTSLTGRRCHTIHSLDQVEPRVDDEGQPKEALFLLSLGLQHNPSQGAFSVPMIVDEILADLERAEDPLAAKDAFLTELSRWGSPGSPRYDHSKAWGDSHLATAFSVAIEPRLYRLADPKLRLLRTRDLKHTIVRRSGVSYRAEFPDSVPGSPGNPIRGWTAAADILLNG